MDTKLVFGLLGIFLTFFQFVPYIFDILKRKTKPHMFTWLVWGLLTLVVFLIQYSNSSGISSFTTGVTSLFCVSIAILAIKYGFKDFTKLDFFCLTSAIIAIFLWTIAHNPLMSVLLISFADIVGIIPTVRKSILDPYSETVSSYFVSGVKWVFSLIALKEFTLINSLYQVSMVICAFSVVLIILYLKFINPKK